MLLPVFHLSAQSIQLGPIEIEQPWSVETAPGAPVGAGYLIIRNTGSTTERLLGGSSNVAGQVQVHTMAMESGVAKMRHLKNGVEIPAGAEIVLKPGSYHLMLMQLEEQLRASTTAAIVLQFENAGEVSVDFNIIDRKAAMNRANNEMSGHSSEPNDTMKQGGKMAEDQDLGHSQKKATEILHKHGE